MFTLGLTGWSVSRVLLILWPTFAVPAKAAVVSCGTQKQAGHGCERDTPNYAETLLRAFT